ncbi:hypothetical protein Jab_1c07080 [Janthinobacterium sp. HH01]|nr:hypothetical protein Jab_1c07080 [Janthinobacterium sp. HH01]
MTTRAWLVRWIYMTVAAHLVVGVLLPLCAGAATTDRYRRGIEDFSWHSNMERQWHDDPLRR